MVMQWSPCSGYTIPYRIRSFLVVRNGVSHTKLAINTALDSIIIIAPVISKKMCLYKKDVNIKKVTRLPLPSLDGL